VISSVAYYFSEVADPLSLLDRLTGFVISGFPSIIGFILTGYTLIIGLSGTDITSVFKKIPNGQNYSYFMIVSSIFAVVLGFVVLTYILACLISYIQCLQIVWPWHLISANQFNIFCLFAFMFIFFYSICALLDVIVNVFNLSLVINKTKQESKNKE
jgi:hypothetical protein